MVESVEQTTAGGRYKAPKAEQARAVTLPAFAVDELRRLKRKQAKTVLGLGVRQTGDSLVCRREEGRRYGFMTCVTVMPPSSLVEGIHPEGVQERLGHSSIAIALDLYSHVIGTLQEDVATRLDLAFGPAIRRLSRASTKTQ